MSVSTLSFSANLPPFYSTSGYDTNFSNANTSISGNLLIATAANGATGQNSTTISSGVSSNGISYAESGATLNGNQLTVNYQTDSTDLNALTNADVNGGGVDFSPAGATAGGGSLATSYGITPNGALNEAIQGAAVSTGTGGGPNIQLESVATVGNSLTVTYQVGGQPVNTTTLAPAAAPQSSAPSTPVFSGTSENGAGFASQSITSIGTLLADASNLSASGSLGGALQAQAGSPPLSNSSPDALLAATLDPGSDLSPSASLQVADFSGTSSGSSAAGSTFTASADTASASQGGGFDFSNASGPADFTSSPVPSTAQTGIYSAIANASTSNILGGNINTVA